MLLLVKTLKFISNYNGNKLQIRNVQVAHNCITFFSIILHFCLGNLNWNRASTAVCHQVYLPGWELWKKTHNKHSWDISSVHGFSSCTIIVINFGLLYFAKQIQTNKQTKPKTKRHYINAPIQKRRPWKVGYPLRVESKNEFSQATVAFGVLWTLLQLTIFPLVEGNVETIEVGCIVLSVGMSLSLLQRRKFLCKKKHFSSSCTNIKPSWIR